MNHRLLRTFAAINALLIVGGAIAVSIIAVASISNGQAQDTVGADILMTFVIVALALLTLLIVHRRPENRLGLGLALLSLFVVILGASEDYATYGTRIDPGSLPHVEVAAWLASWLWVPALMPLLTLLFLLCPDGRPPTPAWNKVLAAVSINLAVLSVAAALKPGPIEGYTQFDNPFGLAALGQAVEIVGTIAIMLLVPCIGLCAVAMVQRFRRARGIERQQLKWFALSGVGALGSFIVAWIIALNQESDAVWDYAFTFAIGFVTFATSLAVLRYHLYDIDHILNRTLVYGLLTIGLGAVYVGTVVSSQELLNTVSGGSDLAIALTTLIVAALFLPARRHVQQIVDRRFNRRQFNAALTIDAFSARLRQQIDLDTLRYELLAVVDETMEPNRMSLWVRRGE
jgi:hypothetical protein